MLACEVRKPSSPSLTLRVLAFFSTSFGVWPKTIIEKGDYGKHKVLNSGEGFIEIEINNEKAVILTVPYPSEKRLNEVLYNDMDEEE